jgi:8-oxo-dGTP pyrophosphatase MutT (NUDIX family)
MTRHEGRPAWLATLATAVDEVDPLWLSRFQPPPIGGRDSAVLVLIGPHEDSDLGTVVLTERAATMRSHPGQVSFPGGVQDPGDDGPVGAALREGEEEVGLDPSGVEIVTVLPSLFLPVSDHVVTPVVGWWQRPGPIDARNPAEVARAVIAPVATLVDPANRFTVTHPSGFIGPGFAVDGLFVWGFTAGLLSKILELGGVDLPWDQSVRVPVSLDGARR